MTKPRDIISDKRIDKVFASLSANFGNTNNRTVVNLAVLNCACGYSSGSTVTEILKRLSLTTTNDKLTRKGRRYLWAAYSKNYGGK